MSKLKRKFGKRMKYNYKRTFFALFLFLILLGVGVGFSYLTTNLSIDGTSNVRSARWDIHFNNIQVKTGSVTATSNPTISNNTTVNFATTLEEPGDFYEFTVDVVNAGTLNAKLDSISITPNLTNAQKKYFKYDVSYADGDLPILANDALGAGETEKIKVRFEYLVNGDASLYPDEDVSFELSVSMDYSQGAGNAVRNYVYTVNSPTPVQRGSAIPNTITQYSSPEAAMAAFSNRLFYLKHNVRNGLVTNSYVEFVVTPAIVSANSGMVAGTYSLTGVNTYDANASSTGNCKEEYYNSLTGECISPYYMVNKALLLNVFGDSRCTEDSSLFRCNISNYSVRSYKNGFVDVLDNSWFCNFGINSTTSSDASICGGY